MMEFKDLAKKYFEGNGTQTDQLKLLHWLRTNKKNKQPFQQVRDEWEDDDKKAISYSTWKRWEETKLKLSNSNRKSKLFTTFYRAAALIVFGLFVGLLISLPLANKQKIVLNTQAGQTLKLLLPDSSSVILNSSSSIEYSPINFLFNRNVKLSGEAYFDVKHDKLRPFKVETEQLKVKVLGTRFNIQDYSSAKNAFVVLEEGSVKLAFNNKVKLLKPGEMAGLSKSTKRWEVKEVNTKLFTSWTEGTLYFYNTPLVEVVSQLEKRYGAKIEIKDQTLKNILFNTTINNESLQEILDLIKVALPVKVTTQNDHIIFTLDQNRYSKYAN